MPFLFQRPGSPFYQIGFTPKEKLLGAKPFSTKTKYKFKAETILTQVRKELKKASKQSEFIFTDNNILLSQAYQLFLRDRENTGHKLSDKTKGNYSRAFLYFNKFVGDKFINDYTREDYHAFVKSMDKLAQNSRAIYTKCIYAIFRWMVVENMITVNPMKRVSESATRLTIRKKNEVDSLINYAADTKFYWMVLFQLASAFRIDEVLRLKKKDIDKNIIRVFGKGNKYSSIPIIKPMRELLKIMPMPEDPEEPVFKIGYDSAWRFYKRFRIQTAINFHSHDCRKYTLSEMANSGVKINFVQEYARHSSILTTMRYYVENDKKKMAEDIDKKLELFGEGMGKKINCYTKIAIHKSKKLRKSA